MSEAPQGVPEDEMDELYRIIGLGALKYFILKVDPRKNMLFNQNQSISTATLVHSCNTPTRVFARFAS